MKASLFIVMIWSAFLLFFSLLIGGYLRWLLPNDSYGFTIPFVACALGCIILSARELLLDQPRRQRVRTIVTMHGLLIIPAFMAITVWPRSDDGPGLGWIFFVLIGSGVATVIASIIGIVALIRRLKAVRKVSS